MAGGSWQPPPGFHWSGEKGKGRECKNDAGQYSGTIWVPAPRPLPPIPGPLPYFNVWGCKRGLAWIAPVADEDALRLLAPGVSWWYSWGTEAPSSWHPWFAQRRNGNVRFAAMSWGKWGDGPVTVPDYATALLGFNEPNRRDQANMSPEKAARWWPELEKCARQHNIPLVLPSYNDGDPGGISPDAWFDRFFKAYPGAHYDGVAVHAYKRHANEVKSMVTQVAQRFRKPVWLTEFACMGNDDRAKVDFMRDLLPWLDRSPQVATYAWFGILGTPRPRDKQDWLGDTFLVNSSTRQLSELGKLYVHTPYAAA